MAGLKGLKGPALGLIPKYVQAIHVRASEIVSTDRLSWLLDILFWWANNYAYYIVRFRICNADAVPSSHLRIRGYCLQANKQQPDQPSGLDVILVWFLRSKRDLQAPGTDAACWCRGSSTDRLLDDKHRRRRGTSNAKPRFASSRLIPGYLRVSRYVATLSTKQNCACNGRGPSDIDNAAAAAAARRDAERDGYDGSSAHCVCSPTRIMLAADPFVLCWLTTYETSRSQRTGVWTRPSRYRHADYPLSKQYTQSDTAKAGWWEGSGSWDDDDDDDDVY